MYNYHHISEIDGLESESFTIFAQEVFQNEEDRVYPSEIGVDDYQ
jgi:hypothetical protein